MHLGSVVRPTHASLAGRVLQATEDLFVLGLSVVAGGTPEFDCRIGKVCSGFHAHRARLTSKSLSLGTRCERWLGHISPALAFRSWGVALERHD